MSIEKYPKLSPHDAAQKLREDEMVRAMNRDDLTNGSTTAKEVEPIIGDPPSEVAEVDYLPQRLSQIDQVQAALVNALESETKRTIQVLTALRDECDTSINELRRRRDAAVKTVHTVTSFLEASERFASDSLQLVPNHLGTQLED